MTGHVVSPLDLSRTLPVGGELLVPVFLTKTSCHKTTHANGYYGAWPGWAVSVSVLPLTADCSLLKSKYLRVSVGMNRKSALLRRLAPQGEGRLMSQNLS